MSSRAENKGLRRSFTALLHDGEHDAVKAMCPDSYSWIDVHGYEGETPLQRLVIATLPLEDGMVQKEYAQIHDMARWLIKRGADPHEKAAKTAEDENTWGEDDGSDDDNDTGQDVTAKMPIKGHNAVSSLTWLRSSMRRAESIWSQEIAALDELLQIFVSTQADACEKVDIDASMVNFWDELRHDESTHDVLLDTSDGHVGAHRLVLGRASSALHVMLSSGMLEGQQQRIVCQDTSTPAMGLLLDLVYTGSTTRAVALESGLGAFELAHRWQVQHVLPMTERLLVGLLDHASFERIAELAVLKGSGDFERAVAAWAKASREVKCSLDAGRYSHALRKLLGKDEKPAATRKRKSF